MKRSKWPVLSFVKYGALLLVFGFGYHVASQDYPQTAAIVGWIVGFLIGLKLRLDYANMRRNE